MRVVGALSEDSREKLRLTRRSQLTARLGVNSNASNLGVRKILIINPASYKFRRDRQSRETSAVKLTPFLRFSRSISRVWRVQNCLASNFSSVRLFRSTIEWSTTLRIILATLRIS